MELIVINSYGPMASTVISSVIEKFGYINLPIRKRKLEEYVIDKRKIDDTYFKDRTIHVLKNLSNLNSIGGINVIDRNKNKLEKKINLNLIQSDLDNFYNKKYTSLEEMYFDSMLIANKATIYKKKTNTIRGSIELATYIEQNDNKEVFRLYKKKFKKVKFINLDREFTSWLNSLLSQKLFERNRSYLPKIVKLSSRKKDYNNYLLNSNNYQALQINFDEIFLPYTFQFIKKIENFLNINPDIKYQKEFYDLYGSLRDFSSTFNKLDDNVNYLSKYSKNIASKIDKKYPKIILDILFQITYSIDYFTIKNRVKI